ncbi:hypothetical protein [Paracoccus everestensis]|uniref:hypothetical protein n=1 Tax=Paracoccus everestensis TaxID=2903900 RepID=UPI001F1908B0|nr:hypothetical protein [Paracoccus everestensis]
MLLFFLLTGVPHGRLGRGIRLGWLARALAAAIVIGVGARGLPFRLSPGRALGLLLACGGTFPVLVAFAALGLLAARGGFPALLRPLAFLGPPGISILLILLGTLLRSDRLPFLLHAFLRTFFPLRGCLLLVLCSLAALAFALRALVPLLGGRLAGLLASFLGLPCRYFLRLTAILAPIRILRLLSGPLRLPLVLGLVLTFRPLRLTAADRGLLPLGLGQAQRRVAMTIRASARGCRSDDKGLRNLRQ